MANSVTYKEIEVKVGDLVKVSLKLVEGDKERVQIFEGVVLAITGRGDQKMIKVRKNAAGGVGVERTIPLQSPWLADIEVKHSREGVSRAKLYNLAR